MDEMQQIINHAVAVARPGIEKEINRILTEAIIKLQNLKVTPKPPPKLVVYHPHPMAQLFRPKPQAMLPIKDKLKYLDRQIDLATLPKPSEYVHIVLAPYGETDVQTAIEKVRLENKQRQRIHQPLVLPGK